MFIHMIKTDNASCWLAQLSTKTRNEEMDVSIAVNMVPEEMVRMELVH